jgi:hypothetical protein
MNENEQGEARLVRPWYAWDVPTGTLFRTLAEARANPPTLTDRAHLPRSAKLGLLRQYRFEDDGSFCGIAEPVR